jgi:hypothetical protein
MMARDVKHGQTVRYYDGETWTVLDRAPGAASFWLHRRGPEGEWLTARAKASELVLVGDPYASIRKTKAKEARNA